MNETRLVRQLTILGAMAVTSAWSATTHAENILLATPEVQGNQTSDYIFNAPGPGTVTVSLADLGWGGTPSLTSLSFAATTPSSVLANLALSGSTIESGQVSFNVTGPGMFSAVVGAQAAPLLGSQVDLGWYSINMQFTPAVPLPAAGWLMLSGLGGLVVAWRGRRPLMQLPPTERLNHA